MHESLSGQRQGGGKGQREVDDRERKDRKGDEEMMREGVRGSLRPHENDEL